MSRRAAGAALRGRNPLATARSEALLKRMREHRDAPRWNYVCGDRIERGDLRWLEGFREDLGTRRGGAGDGVPPPRVLAALAAAMPRVQAWRHAVGTGVDLAADWVRVPTMSREDLATRPGAFMPDGEDLARMVVHPTSGTTGHAILIPHHPAAGSAYCPMLETAMAAHGVRPRFSDDAVGCLQVGALARTITYATVHAVWGNSGFAKINLREGEWPREGAAARWMAEMAAPVLTATPATLAEMIRMELPVRPLAIVSTATALTPALRDRVRRLYGCPVIDWYSLIETGPLAYACREGDLHVLPHDVHVEVIDGRGRPAGAGRRGEICVSGGRNPYLPLLRYRTGDRARLERKACACGDPAPRLLDFEGRESVTLRAEDGSAVVPVDVSRVLRDWPIVQHRLVQRADRSIDVDLRPFAGGRIDTGAVAAALRGIFGAGA
ncbi:MAG: phenylacetate--CoA ligase family protein, partial [Candidatus Brocadiae bacterium]|nr:phenylacetate--CoA ligase family protein [Candidatus Brocadiia bacterium]